MEALPGTAPVKLKPSDPWTPALWEFRAARLCQDAGGRHRASRGISTGFRVSIHKMGGEDLQWGQNFSKCGFQNICAPKQHLAVVFQEAGGRAGGRRGEPWWGGVFLHFPSLWSELASHGANKKQNQLLVNFGLFKSRSIAPPYSTYPLSVCTRGRLSHHHPQLWYITGVRHTIDSYIFKWMSFQFPF